jgi:hypothetical protein
MSQASQQQVRRSFFEFREEVRAFSRSFSAMVRELVRDNSPISEQNELRLTHGRTWDHSQGTGEGEMQTISAEMSVKFADLMEGRLEALRETARNVADQMNGHFYRMMYQTISESAEKVGNVVSAKDAGSFAAGFIEMFRRIEFGVDRDGQVRMPEIHVGPDMVEKFHGELLSQPPEYHAEIERLKKEKTEAALERERERKARFVRPSN